MKSERMPIGDVKKQESLLQYNLFLKRLEIWQHSEFLKIKIQFKKGTREDREMWQQKTAALDRLLSYVLGENRYYYKPYNDFLSQYPLVTQGWFSKTRSLGSELVDFLRATNDTFLKRQVNENFEGIKELSSKDNFFDQDNQAEHNEVRYLLSQKKLEILHHLGTLQLNEKYDKGDQDEKMIWRDKIKVLKALVNYMHTGDVRPLNIEISLNPLYSKGWFSKTDKYIEEVKELVSRLGLGNGKVRSMPTVISPQPEQNPQALFRAKPRIQPREYSSSDDEEIIEPKVQQSADPWFDEVTKLMKKSSEESNQAVALYRRMGDDVDAERQACQVSFPSLSQEDLVALKEQTDLKIEELMKKRKLLSSLEGNNLNHNKIMEQMELETELAVLQHRGSSISIEMTERTLLACKVKC